MKYATTGCLLKITLFMLGAGMAGAAACQPVQAVLSLAQNEKPALLQTLKELTAIESGSRELAEIDKIAQLVAIEPRLYLATRMMMNIALGKVPLK